MTGFDSTWYHGPFAAGFFQSGNTWDLHFIAPQFLAWFYPANSEIFHAVGMLAFGRDLLSPLLNLGWFVGLPAGLLVHRQAVPGGAMVAGARRDRAQRPGALRPGRGGAQRHRRDLLPARRRRDRRSTRGALAAEGEEAAGSSLSTRGARSSSGSARRPGRGDQAQLPPALRGRWSSAWRWSRRAARRLRALAAAGLAALAGGGYWYLRNLVHTGNPLPWFDHLGPISLPAPDQDLGGRETHAVLGYLADGAVWSDWFLPGLHHGLGIALAAARRRGARRPAALPRPPGELRCCGCAGAVGLAAALAWLVAPTSASGPGGDAARLRVGPALPGPGPRPRPRPAADRPAACATASPPRRGPLRSRLSRIAATRRELGGGAAADRSGLRAGRCCSSPSVAVGYPVQRHYLRDRYANPSFTTPGLNAAFKWARSISGARIATTTTRQYPLFGTDLSNRVQFVGEQRPHGGFVAPSTCRAWRRLLDEGDYDYVVASRDRVEPGKPAVSRRPPAGPKAPAPTSSCASRRRSSSGSPGRWTHRPAQLRMQRIHRRPESGGRHLGGWHGAEGAENGLARRAPSGPSTGPASRAQSPYWRTAHGPHPQLLDHRPHRPRQVDPGRPHPRGHRRRRPEENAGADARLDGPRARARDHDQGPGRAGRVPGRRRADLPPAPDRHARPRRLLLRGLAQPRRLRGRAARRRRRPGGRGADRRQHLPGDRERAGADPGDQQGRPARRRAGAGRPGDRRPDRRRPRGSALDLGEDRRGRGRGAGGDRRAHPGPEGRARRRRPGR